MSAVRHPGSAREHVGRLGRASASLSRVSRAWTLLSPRLLPFADADSPSLPWSRLLRLSLFQVSVGMAAVLLIGTLNRVMIVELGVPASLVAIMVSLPLIFAPFRAVIGFRSDTHRSLLGWRRVPFLWIGTLLQFGGLAIMPFALIVLSGDTHGPAWIGQAGAGLAFLLIGAGLHTTQTVGMALATDLATVETQPRVVALLCMMLLIGMIASAVIFGLLLENFSAVRLIQVIQGAALATVVLNVIALWKQETRRPWTATVAASASIARPRFAEAWRAFRAGDGAGLSGRSLVAVALGSAAFSMEDILLEPYGGHVLNLSVAATTSLSALLAVGGLAGFGLAARQLGRGADPYRMCSAGLLAGIVAFSLVIFSEPLVSPTLFAAGTLAIGFGGGIFAHSTLTAAMRQAPRESVGLTLGVWGAVQATAAGVAVAAGGILRDVISALAEQGLLGSALTSTATGYSVVYHIEILLLFATLVCIGPLVRRARTNTGSTSSGSAQDAVTTNARHGLESPH